MAEVERRYVNSLKDSVKSRQQNRGKAGRIVEREVLGGDGSPLLCNFAFQNSVLVKGAGLPFLY